MLELVIIKSQIRLKIGLYLDEVDTLDDVDIDDDVETELDVDTLVKKKRKIISSSSSGFCYSLKSCLNDNKIDSVFTSYSWVLQPNITTRV